MRKHGRFGQLAPHIDPERFHRIVSPENLAAARLDTGYSARIDNYGCLDLTFASDGEIVVVPYVILQGIMLFAREGSPFVWPSWLPPVRSDALRAIEAFVEPWLRSLAVARFVNGEIVKLFGKDERAHRLFEKARDYGFLGAAPTERVVELNAPYVYALRFAANKRVAISDRNGAGGAALLARVANVDANVKDKERADAARHWFGLNIFDRTLTGEYDVAVGTREGLPDARARIVLDEPQAGERCVRVAHAIPLSVMVSFDVADGAQVRRFAASTPPVTFRPHGNEPAQIVGGSSGRIGLVVRDDHAGVDDADVDAAIALEGHLAAQGFSARVVGASHVRPADFDLLHVFGYRCANALGGAFTRAGGSSVPIVLTPYLDDPKREAEWGMAVAREALANAADEALRETYLTAIGNRRLSAPNSPGLGATAAVDPVVRSLFASARAIVAGAQDEEARIREEFSYGGAIRFAPAVLADEIEPSDEIGSLAGLEEFVLVHGPLDARSNQYLVARACASLGYPLVLAGSVVNTEYYGDVLAALGTSGIWIPSDELSPREIAALYRRARVYVDASWTSAGLYRLVRAGAAGAALVAPASGSARMLWPGIAQIVDPASPTGIAEGIATAWKRAGELGPATARRTLESYRPFDMLVATLGAYQAAAQPTAAPPAAAP
ncbi:MAG TPA: hypothetical protein VKR05_01680 [Candidatus Cybelea sp.]|nr:hypothetical protein [Candidatus Cybelea sp.]